ncbi:4-(cytidine 5'-diphospho)-2-C-methyl-D-erythritol kinase [Dietzia psychralcaliphila]|uniref:4-diphosphocytidyl-2-C-methyl-D-erythritol kinase n=1 Tax=Dietzia psychralcaliphila TaxID=139021 RepID=A0AAD0JT13_9ACTN|nr:4-(cytidine 5'-diphospho)-2-C-methyl-D-erythritol kinase [Dietzia psychralcaliphila]AWH96047.1 4-(cytidine 5'-diphospho)-2-C-methyl-D-erythritol kinase [Dietzia psychralcaliphila]PTM90908.1 4-diphosphocytidyl-2-C-methyl-D-erythritol kinase [Dietzia psychralcaliphila]
MPRDVSTPAGARAVTAVAPAKINLHLGVGDLRADGFHDLLTVYRAVDLWEQVTVALVDDDDPDVVVVSGPGAAQVPTDRTNLAAKAVDLLRGEAGSGARLAIRIVKGVPVAGGMAGGSADAAAALVATDRLLGLGLGRAALEERAARLGSDVPFCIRGGTALGTGRGETLAPLLHARAEQHVVVAIADGGLSTPVVFAELDRLRAERSETGRDLPRSGGVEALVEALAGQDPARVAGLLANDLEPAALSLMPALRKTLRAGAEAGALHGMVSGSGPTCLFFCADREQAIAVAAEVSETGVAREVRLTHGPVGGAHVIDNPQQTPQKTP